MARSLANVRCASKRKTKRQPADDEGEAPCAAALVGSAGHRSAPNSSVWSTGAMGWCRNAAPFGSGGAFGGGGRVPRARGQRFVAVANSGSSATPETKAMRRGPPRCRENGGAGGPSALQWRPTCRPRGPTPLLESLHNLLDAIPAFGGRGERLLPSVARCWPAGLDGCSTRLTLRCTRWSWRTSCAISG
jgi:hypothetical protein